MSENTGRIWDVIRPDDGVRTQITCTQEQLEAIWLPAGYVLVESTEPEAGPTKQSRKR